MEKQINNYILINKLNLRLIPKRINPRNNYSEFSKMFS